MSGVSLSKGSKVSLSKEAPGGLNAVTIGLGWDEKTGGASGADFDLDASLFACGANGQVRNDKDFIFYGNLRSDDGSIVHQGDNLTGAGDGDDEQIMVDLAALPTDIEKLAVAVTIHEAESRGQNFGQVENAFIRVVDNNTGNELARYDLSEDFSTETAVIFGEVYRHNGEWKMKAVGQGFPGGLKPVAEAFGVNIG